MKVAQIYQISLLSLILIMARILQALISISSYIIYIFFEFILIYFHRSIFLDSFLYLVGFFLLVDFPSFFR